MKRYFILLLVVSAILSLSAVAVFALGPAPSWELSLGAAATCTVDGGFSLPGVSINAPSPASERGTLNAPGFPNLGFTQDTNFTGVGSYGFFVFATAPYTLPANTPLTLTVTTYPQPNYQGNPAYISSVTWNCTTGAVLALSNGVPLPSCPYPLGTGATMRNVPLGAPAYYAADPGTRLTWDLPAGNWWVKQISGDFAQVWIACQATPVWIPVSALG